MQELQLIIDNLAVSLFLVQQGSKPVLLEYQEGNNPSTVRDVLNNLAFEQYSSYRIIDKRKSLVR